MKKEFVMLAHTYKPEKHIVAGWYMSEKLDGRRAYWDGGVSRGCLATDVPWANTVKDKKPKFATGLWSRAGKVIHAPDWWVDTLPKIPLDGELFCGHGGFQTVSKITARHTPTHEWNNVEYKVFDSPINLYDRKITVRDYTYRIEGAADWAMKRMGVTYPSPRWNFEMVQTFLKGKVNGRFASVIEQTRLSCSHTSSVDQLEVELDRVCALGGEGLMFRKPESFWQPVRSHELLKYKPNKIGTGTVTGYKHAELGKIQGMMGALILDYKGKRLKISGFTDQERDYGFDGLDVWLPPGTEATSELEHSQFPRGMTVRFKYRELTDDGIPKEARFMR